MIDERPGRTTETRVVRYDGSEQHEAFDAVTTEEPLEIRLVAADVTRTLAVTMRTPGNDFELATGFVTGESIVRSRDEIEQVSYCIDPAIDPTQRYNIVNVALRSSSVPDVARLERHFTMNSSCGVCGRANLEALRDLGIAKLDDAVRVPIATIYALSDRMAQSQRVFATTGGLHAAALFAANGEPLVVREDVGRHNAFDKIVGWAQMNARLPLHSTIVLVSGRASYEIVQKATVARIPVVAAVSAPSSLAVDLAREFNITLIGFVRGARANVYSAPERITA